MLISMTGFGKGTSVKGDHSFQIVVKTYNARFLETKIKGISLAPDVEMSVRGMINEKLFRGSIQVQIESINESNNGKFSFNRQRFESLEKILMSIQKEYGRTLDINHFISADDLLMSGENEVLEKNEILSALDQALKQVINMRNQEGLSIQNDIKVQLNFLDNQLAEIQRITRINVQDQNEKLRNRIQELMGNAVFDDQRFAQEIAIIADRLDISEEIVRIQSHLVQFKRLMELEEPVGKRLAFLLQELSREINTIGSKCGNGDIINLVVDFKNHLEKIREQVQNVL